MASDEEIRKQQELNNLEQERRGITEDTLDNIRSTANVLQDQIRFLKFEREERTQIRSISKQISKIASENYSISINELGTQKNISKLQQDQSTISERLTQLLELRKSLGQKGVQINQDLANSIKSQVEEAVELRRELKQIEKESENIAKNFAVKGFSIAEDIVGAIPGLRQFQSAFTNTSTEARKVAAAGSGSFKAFIAGSKELSTTFSKLAGAAILGAVINSFQQLNKAQTDFRRNVGASINQIDTLNDSLLTSVDYIQQANALTEQFGFNASVAFSNINIQEAAELTQLMGLSAEEANNLAMFSQANGESLKENAAQAYKNISPLLSQRKVLQEISKVSPSIAMSFGGSAEELAKAASNARLLGLNLSQVDKIADRLLDIEQSLTSEFEAEVITGKQLNLERARFFALTNDIDGLTKEIASNQEVINSFTSGTRIEQQAIADAMGLSRDEISKMLFDQQILNKLSVEEAALKSGMSIEDAKRLTIQESINNSIAKMAEALAFPAEIMASLVDNAFILYSVMGAIGTIMTVNLAKSLGGALISMAAMIPKATTLLGIEVGVAAARMASASALTLGLGAIGVLAATAAGVAGISALVKNAQQVNDGIAPSDKGPFTITDSFGATAITAKGDGLAVSPNIRREERNNPATVAIDYEKLADAIARGAERGTSKANINVNLDGNRVSNTLQTPLAVNTRKYAV